MASFFSGLFPSLNKSSNSSAPSQNRNSNPMCNHCKVRNRYTDGVVVHPYCGLTCANLAKVKRSANRPSVLVHTRPLTRSYSVTNRTTDTSEPSLTWSTSSNQLCLTPGCSYPVYIDSNGFPGWYCTKAHEVLGRNGCLYCRRAPTNGSTVFCQPCYEEVLNKAPMIVRVPEEHERYRSVASQFLKKWLHGNKSPGVREIYKIVVTAESMEKYQQYLNRVEARGNFTSQRKSRGNENRRWHGTMRTCNVGEKGVTQFCSDSLCSLCSIMKSSFDRSLSVSSGMFGAGIYTSATSSKSDCFSTNVCTSDRKAMLLNKVVVGRGYRMKTANGTLTEPPAGYDSVLAEVGAGLNYDELVVYDNDAIRPSYLVMYDMPE